MEKGSTQSLWAVLDAHNKLRADPTAYVPLLEAKLEKFQGNKIEIKPNFFLVTKEGPDAVKYVYINLFFREAIKFLEKQKPIGELKMSKALNKAAQDHANDTGKNGINGHTGTGKYSYLIQ